jgi:hypothetical protein
LGDRCFLKLTLRGCIESPRHLVRIAKAIVAEGLTSSLPFGQDEVDGVYAYLCDYMDVNAGDDNPEFTDAECNYANIDDLETVLVECGMPYNVYHGSGGGYAAGCWSWTPEHGRVEASCLEDGDTIVTTYNIEKALEIAKRCSTTTSLPRASGCRTSAWATRSSDRSPSVSP